MPFLLFGAERQEVALGVLTQNLGPARQPEAYFSKQLDTVAARRLECLRAVAAVLLVEEATKLTLGQSLEVQTPHQVQGVLEIKEHIG